MSLPAPIPLEEAQARLLALASPLPVETVPSNEALGRHLAQPLCAQRTQPPADLSAMDGYAIAGEAPWQIIGESRCGEAFEGAIAAGQAIRISTGATIPDGGQAVLLQENANRNGNMLSLNGEGDPTSRHIRRKGFDFTEGDGLLPAGTRIGPAQLALAIAAGHGKLPVRRVPVIAILDSGDELAADPESCAADQIPASNGAMLAALCNECLPCDIRRIGPVPDRREALEAALAQADGADILVTSGGASVGDHDLMRPVLEAWGAHIDFWRVAIRPGKPLIVAQKGPLQVVGLPGNPVSSFVTAQLFLLPLLRTLAGALEPNPPRITARTAMDLPPIGKRRQFLRAYWDGAMVQPLSEQDSSALRSLANANALIERPEHSGEAKAGTDVPIILIHNGSIA